MKFTLVSGIVLLTGLKITSALPAPPDPLSAYIGEIFYGIYNNCEKEEGTFYFKDFENAICLKQKTGDVIDFSENTEIVGTHFGRDYNYGFKVEDNKLLAYTWYDCDSSDTPLEANDRFTPYNHEECMKKASKFRNFENPAGIKIIEELIRCENVGNAFYYRNDSVDNTKFDFICLEERPLDYYRPDYLGYYNVPKNCIIKDNKFMCGQHYSINEQRESINKYAYEKSDPNEFYQKLLAVVYEIDFMNRYDLTPIDFKSNEKTSVTTLIGDTRSVTAVLKIPENVNKMTMHCFGQYGGTKRQGRECFLSGNNYYTQDCYDFYTVFNEKDSCYVFTQKASPISTSTRIGKCDTVATLLGGILPKPTFTTTKFCNTETYYYNPTYAKAYNGFFTTTTSAEPTPVCNHGYPCCKECGEVYYVDDDANWGVENNDWCEMPSNC